MKKLLLPFLFLLSFFVSSPQVSFGQTTVIDSIVSGGIYRNYRLYVPAAYNGTTAWPLILNIHGYTSNAASEQAYTNFGPIADTAHFLMVYPNATVYMGQPTWNSGFGMAVDDIGFLSNLIDSLSAQYNIDQNAIYSCGMSNGGYMSHTLACALSNKIAAIASVTGTMTPIQHSTCNPGRPVPVMDMHGTADGTVPFAGSIYSLAIDSVVKYWVDNNACNPTPVFTAVPNINLADGCTAEHYVYNGGAMGSTVEFYKIIGGGHTWPGSPFVVGVTNEDFNGSEKIWLFFRKYKLNMFVGVNELSTSESINIFPNPAATVLNIDVADVASVVVCDVNGKQVQYSTMKQIDISSLSKGVYVVLITSKNQRFAKRFVKQ